MRIRAATKLAVSVIAATSVLAVSSPIARAADRNPAPLTIFYADSLTGYVSALAKQFEAAHPGVQVRREGSGSLDAIRKIADLHLACDVLITADWRLLKTPRHGIEPWAVAFAGNQMGIVYTAHSRGAAKIDRNNWFRILLDSGARYGHSNPERDPAGYWTLILWNLAERYYREPGLAARLNADCPLANVRPHNVDLIALLESGELDYYFGYASDARLGNLRFLALPTEINLSDISQAAGYATAVVEVGAGAARKRIAGAPIAYGVTLTAKPPNRDAAVEFIRMMLGEAGRRAAQDAGIEPYAQSFAWDPQARMPPVIRAMTTAIPADQPPVSRADPSPSSATRRGAR